MLERTVNAWIMYAYQHQHLIIEFVTNYTGFRLIHFKYRHYMVFVYTHGKYHSPPLFTRSPTGRYSSILEYR
jgi:hypothetical protein